MKPGERIRDFREAEGINQVDFAKALGISQGYLGQIEIGLRDPSREFLKKIYKAYGVSADYILHGKEYETSSRHLSLHEPQLPYKVITSEQKRIIDDVLEILDSDDEVTTNALKGNIRAFLEAVRIKKRNNQKKGGV
jgi:transcriptional regulator with XRE-family HTH domain